MFRVQSRLQDIEHHHSSISGPFTALVELVSFCRTSKACLQLLFHTDKPQFRIISRPVYESRADVCQSLHARGVDMSDPSQIENHVAKLRE